MRKYSILLLFTFLFTNATLVGLLDLIPFVLHKISLQEIIASSPRDIKQYSFHQDDFVNFIIDESEFRWNGEMFDILSSRTIGDSVFVLAYQDTKETLILKGIEEQSNNDRSTLLIKKILSLVYDLPINESFLINYLKSFSPQKHYFILSIKDVFSTKYFHPPIFNTANF